MTVSNKLNYLNNTKTAIREAIIAKGVEVSPSDTFRSYAEKISQIQNSGGGEEPIPPVVEEKFSWNPPSDWINIKDGISDNEFRFLVSDEYFDYEIGIPLVFTVGLYGQLTINWGDGSPEEVITGGREVSHEFLESGGHSYDDRGITRKQFMVSIKGNLKSVIFSGENYYTLPVLWIVNNINNPSQLFDVNFKSSKINNTRLQCYDFMNNVNPLMTSSSTNGIFSNCRELEEIKTATPLTSTHSTSKTYFMYKFASDCYSLRYIPEIDTSQFTNFSSAFSNCHSITELPTLNTSACTNFINTFMGCSSLKKVEGIDTSKASNLSSMFSGCTSIESIPEIQLGVKGINLDSFVRDCKKLKSVTFKGDLSNVSNADSTFTESCVEVIDMDISNIKYSSYLYLLGIDYSTPTKHIRLTHNNPTNPILCQLKPGYQFSSTVNTVLSLLDLNFTSGVKFAGSTPQILLDYCTGMSPKAINYLLSKLPEDTGKVISIKGHPVRDLIDDSIATKKGWTVLK